MDADKRASLIEKIMEQYDEGMEYPLVNLEGFFAGNTDNASLAPNLGDEHPGVEKFAAVLRAVSERKEVSGVLVAILECPEADEEADADFWPSGENVHVITSASAEEVEAWVADLKCNGVSDGWPYGEPDKMPVIPKGYGVRTLFWD